MTAAAPDPDAVARFGAALARLDAEVDWDLVATVYCEGDAAGFFDEERRGGMTTQARERLERVLSRLQNRRNTHAPGGTDRDQSAP